MRRVTYRESLAYLQGTNRAFCKPGTERVSALCSLLGNPQDRLSVIHVAGTNGKGSFCVFLDALLQQTGGTVGRFSSPALTVINECVTVNGNQISDEDFARLVTAIQPLADGLEDRPTEFEILTALAFVYFAEQGCDFVIVECGMGGLTDATNILSRPRFSVITEISVDHASFLGDTVREIATQKAGIIKENCPVLWCGKNQEAEVVIRETARKNHAGFFTVPRASLRIKRGDLSGTVFDFDGHTDLVLSSLGLYQADNGANALTALKLLGISLSESQLKEGLFRVRFPGRFEVLSQNPLVIADGGHNPDGVVRALESVTAYFPGQKIVFVSGIMKDKDYQTVVKLISPFAHCVYTVTPENPRALSSEEYAQAYRSEGVSAHPCESVAEAVRRGISHGLPVVCLGSLYQYKAVVAACEDLALDK